MVSYIAALPSLTQNNPVFRPSQFTTGSRYHTRFSLDCLFSQSKEFLVLWSHWFQEYLSRWVIILVLQSFAANHQQQHRPWIGANLQILANFLCDLCMKFVQRYFNGGGRYLHIWIVRYRDWHDVLDNSFSGNRSFQGSQSKSKSDFYLPFFTKPMKIFHLSWNIVTRIHINSWFSNQLSQPCHLKTTKSQKN